MNSSELRLKILHDSAECARLHTRVHDTFKHRTVNDEKRQEWFSACAEFHARYDLLSFPGGYSTAWERIAQGDVEAIEAAVLFLEIRPYFFRSGYMFKDLLRKCKRAALSQDQAARLAVVSEKLGKWKAEKRRGNLNPHST